MSATPHWAKRDERPPVICDHKSNALRVVGLDRFYLYMELINKNIILQSELKNVENQIFGELIALVER